jgi:hypothetical protein
VSSTEKELFTTVSKLIKNRGIKNLKEECVGS